MDLDTRAPHETLQHSVEIIPYNGSSGGESQIHMESYLLLC